MTLLCSPKAVPAARSCTVERDQPPKLSLEKVLHLLRKPDARLVRLHSNNGGAGFYVWPNGGHVSNEVVQLLLGRNDIQPYGNGLFSDHPQSWRLGNWRDWAKLV